MKTFKHSGDIGDVIYGLYAMKKLGGGILYLDTNAGKDDEAITKTCSFGKTKFNKKAFDYLYPLLKCQPYINDVKEYNGEHIDINLNLFRTPKINGTFEHNIINLHLIPFGLPLYDHQETWLTIDDEIKLEKEIIINRTPRYNYDYTWYAMNHKNLEETAIFIGLEKEHDIFEYTFNCKIKHHKTKNALEVAKIIKGAKHLIANQSSTLAIALGLGTTKILQEVYGPHPDCVYKKRKNMKYMNL